MSLTSRRLVMGRTGYGASEVGALIAPSKWSNPSTLYLKRLNPGLDTGSSLPADLGTLLEEPLAKLYAERTGVFLARVQTLRHPTKEIAIATPDRAVFATSAERGDARRKLERDEVRGASKLLQLKTTDERNRNEWGTPGTDAIPDGYLAQVQWEMGVAGVGLCDVGVLFGRSAFELFPVVGDASIFEGLVELVERFEADHVRPAKPPPPDYGERYGELVKSLFPRAVSPVREATLEEEELARRFAVYREIEKRAAREKEKYGTALRAAIGDALGLTFPELGKVSLKNNPDTKRVRWPEVVEQLDGLLRAAGVTAPPLADIIAAHTTLGPGPRVMRPTFAPVALTGLVEEAKQLAAGAEVDDEE